MKTNPRFHIGERVEASREGTRLGEREARVREIVPSEFWTYTVEATDGSGTVQLLTESELAPVESERARLARERQERIEHHAELGRKWAEAADREEVDGGDAAIAAGGPDSDPVSARRNAQERAQRFAAISQAHSLAAVASTLAESAVAIEQ
jgi:hypothetical protein